MNQSVSGADFLASLFSLEGKAALVTGASSGFGRRFAITLARAGAHVAVAARRIDALQALTHDIEAFDGRALPLRLDVTDEADVREAVKAAETELGAISILVNNAGIAEPKWISEMESADYDRLMNTNLRGAWLVAREVGRHMIKHGHGGKIINMASMAAFRAENQLSLYSMAKSALIQMTRSMALEWARDDIQVNALAPGYFETEMNSAFFKTALGQEQINAYLRKRIGQPDDLDGVLLLLASGASDFMTGSTILIDDGQSLS